MLRECGTCRLWNPEGGDDFRERMKRRFKEPTCNLDGKVRQKGDEKGCWGWKEADATELIKRGYILEEV